MSGSLTSHPQPEANLGYLFRLAHQRFRAALDEALEDLGLSAHEYGILSASVTRTELSASELARITQVTRQTMHTAVLGLEAATERVRAIEGAALAGLGRNDERVIRTWLANLAAVTDEHSADRGRADRATRS